MVTLEWIPGHSDARTTAARSLQHDNAAGAATSRRVRNLAGSADEAAVSAVRGPGRGRAVAAGDEARAAAHLQMTAPKSAADDASTRGRALAAQVAAADPDPDPEDEEADEEASMLPENRAADAVDPLIEPGCEFQLFVSFLIGPQPRCNTWLDGARHMLSAKDDSRMAFRTAAKTQGWWGAREV